MAVFKTFSVIRHSSWASTDKRQWTTFGTGEPGGEYYNDSIQIFCVDLRSMLQGYPGWFIDGIQIETWSRKKKHSANHRRWLTDINMTPGSLDPRNQPHSMIGSHLTPDSWIETSKNGVTSRRSTLYPYNPIPTERFADRLMAFGFAGQQNSRRSYGYLGVYGLSLFRMRPGFPGWAGDVMSRNGKAVPGYMSQLVSGAWATSFVGGKEWW